MMAAENMDDQTVVDTVMRCHILIMSHSYTCKPCISHVQKERK